MLDFYQVYVIKNTSNFHKAYDLLRKGGDFASIIIKYMIYVRLKHILNIWRQHDQTQQGKA